MDNDEPVVFRTEAEKTIKEISYAVNHVEISPDLPSADDVVYMNITTKEKQTYTVELSARGFKVVGTQYNSMVCQKHCVSETISETFYETIYALLDTISPDYRYSFGSALMNKLTQLQHQQKN